MSAYHYSERFFNFVDASAGRSASGFLDRFDLGFEVKSVLDVGCARGSWLAAWMKRGAADVLGVDSGGVDSERLLIPPTAFRAVDVSKPFSLDRHFDLAQCLEVGEHLDRRDAPTLVKNLAAHADIVLFSAATPGQGGEFHVNEQPLEYWAGLFAASGYRAFDYPRAALREAREIEPWYRFNTVLYANQQGISRLGAAVKEHEVPPGVRFKNRASMGWRFRCLILRTLPAASILWLAQVKHRIYLAVRS